MRGIKTSFFYLVGAAVLPRTQFHTADGREELSQPERALLLHMGTSAIQYATPWTCVLAAVPSGIVRSRFIDKCYASKWPWHHRQSPWFIQVFRLKSRAGSSPTTGKTTFDLHTVPCGCEGDDPRWPGCNQQFAT